MRSVPSLSARVSVLRDFVVTRPSITEAACTLGVPLGLLARNLSTATATTDGLSLVEARLQAYYAPATA